MGSPVEIFKNFATVGTIAFRLNCPASDASWGQDPNCSYERPIFRPSRHYLIESTRRPSLLVFLTAAGGLRVQHEDTRHPLRNGGQRRPTCVVDIGGVFDAIDLTRHPA